MHEFLKKFKQATNNEQHELASNPNDSLSDEGASSYYSLAVTATHPHRNHPYSCLETPRHNYSSSCCGDNSNLNHNKPRSSEAAHFIILHDLTQLQNCLQKLNRMVKFNNPVKIKLNSKAADSSEKSFSDDDLSGEIDSKKFLICDCKNSDSIQTSHGNFTKLVTCCLAELACLTLECCIVIVAMILVWYVFSRFETSRDVFLKNFCK